MKRPPGLRPAGRGRTGPWRRAAALTLLLVAAPGGWALGAPKTAKADSHAEATASVQKRKELQGEQRELKARLAQLKKSLASTESAHSEAADALAAAESAISNANRHLQQLAASRRQIEQRIAELQASQRDAAQAQNAHVSRLGLVARKEYELLSPPPLLEWLDPLQSLQDQRDSAYLDRIVRERLRRIDELDDRRVHLSTLESESRQREAELARVDADERASRALLLKQEAARKAALARLAKEVASQRQSVASLERDDTRMSSLIEQIDRLLAEQARKASEARRKSAAKGEKGGELGSLSPLPDRFQPPSATQFGHLRGKLVLPVQGPVGSRYGAPRLGEDGQPQAGAPTWKGLFIKAPEGSPVHAIAAGRVVFADWLRGFGNLMILDHGEGFLSVYANNETLLHSLGDQISADEVIASVGNTGGNPQSGLYFEMRYQGHPFDPLSWAVAR